MHLRFYRLITQINNHETTVEEATKTILDLMTDDEHLALLQGNWFLTQYLSDNKASAYPAAVVSRLGVPGLHVVDGSRQSFFTEYPSPLGRAASFNLRLEELIGEAIGVEVRAHGGNLYTGICLNVTRRSDWGRAHSSYGEDPLVIRRMGTAAARGARKHVMVGVRHFALNSMESLREDGRITCDEKTMNELFLQHFKDVLCESGAEAVLSAGNLVNGVACAENPALLNGILRERWGLDDLIVASDCTWPVKNGPASIKAGLDLEMPFSTGRTAAVENALEHGTLDWTQIEVLAQRIVSTQLRYYCRMINVPLPRSQRIRCQRHVSLARQSVAESMVLLKNDNNFLPLSASSNLKLTVLGVLADRVSTAHQFDVSSHAQGPPGTSPLEELRKRHNLVIDYMENNEKSRATKSASTADAVIIFLRPSGKVECVCKVVVVIEAGTTVTIPAYIRQKATSILFSSYGCRQYGKGLRDVLFGEQEPSGRLPFVLPDTEEQLLERSGSESSSHEFRYDDKWGYRKLQHEQQKPAYPFGFGLGYSTFTLTSPWYERPVVKPSFDMTVNATNTGNRVSAVVVQVYASRNFSSSSSSASSRRDSVVFNGTSSRLIGFAKELVKPGENVEIAISCRLSPLAEFISATGKMAVAAGEYGLVVCQHEGDRGAVLSSFRISGEVLC